MDFPHLKDNQFPFIDNVNVYKYQNNFDYGRWKGEVSFKLLNVLWNSNYADVPYFDTVELRDKWFNEQEGTLGTFDSKNNNTPNSILKIPVPYNDAYKYNYLMLDMPIQTSLEEPLNYTSEETRVKRWFYFIDDAVQFAPNTTELHITLDYWTTFIHSVNIPYLMLERGHAPMTQVSVDDFLANPIDNNEFLLADDFNYGTDTLIKKSNYKPIGNKKKYVLFCAPYNRYNWDLFDSSEFSGNSTPPRYTNTDDRWGYQYRVNDYEWKYGGSNYTNARLPITNEIQTGMLNGCECYAIEGKIARQFFNEMATKHAHFIHGIQAMFILDEDLFERSDSFTFNGYTIYIADREINVNNIEFKKTDFDFDEKYSEITKLYTSPYSVIEITDDDGNSFEAKIENCSNVQMYTEVSLVYPFLNYNVLFSGINGKNTRTNYEWKACYEDTVYHKSMWESDFSKYMMNWNVPTYSIFVSSEYEYASNNAGNVLAEREKAIVEYENNVRPVNTDRENVYDESETRNTNTGIANATRSSVTSSLNAKNSSVTNILNNRDSDGVEINNQKISDDIQTDNRMVSAKAAIEMENATLTGVANSVAQLGGSVALGAALGGQVGAAIGLGGGLIAAASGVSTLVGVANTEEEAGAIIRANGVKGVRTVATNTAIVNLNNGARDSVTDVENATNTAITNAENSRDSRVMANRTATDNSNATYTRNALVLNAKNTLELRQYEADKRFLSARLNAPAEYGGYNSATMGQDVYMRRGVRINIRTQSKSAIAQAGDAFLRFGYALHRVWDMSKGFHYGKEFTFWKAEDIWINDGSGVANIATNTIGEILMKGVTVWRDPTKIGLVGIYDNM